MPRLGLVGVAIRRACLATARRLRRTVLTAERGWRNPPNLGIGIRIIR